MKNGRAFLAILFACVLGVSAITTVSAQDNGLFDLAVTQVETEPFAAAVGEEVTVYATYENLLPAPVPSGLLLDLSPDRDRRPDAAGDRTMPPAR